MRYIPLLLITLLFSCGSNKQDEIKEMKDQVIEIHDEVMPRMGELNKVRKDLLLQADSFIETDSVKAISFTKAVANIEGSEKSMRNWMLNFELEYEGTDEEIIHYLKDQKKAILQVQEEMNGSIEKGKAILNN